MTAPNSSPTHAQAEARGVLRSTAKAPTELRQLMRNPMFVPGPMNAEEQRDYAAYLQRQDVWFKWGGSLFDPGITTREDQCPHIRAWRVERKEATYAK